MLTTNEIVIKLPDEIRDDIEMFKQKGYNVLVQVGDILGIVYLKSVEYSDKGVIRLCNVVLFSDKDFSSPELLDEITIDTFFGEIVSKKYKKED